MPLLIVILLKNPNDFFPKMENHTTTKMEFYNTEPMTVFQNRHHKSWGLTVKLVAILLHFIFAT